MSRCALLIKSLTDVWIPRVEETVVISTSLISRNTALISSRNVIYRTLRYARVFFAIFLGCFATCLPARVAFLLALVVAAYSFDESALIAADGRYRSPVAFGPCVDGLPLFVRHFCLVQLFKERWLFFSAIFYLHCQSSKCS